MFNYDDEKLSKSGFTVITIFILALVISIVFLSLTINKNKKEFDDKTYENGESAYEIAVRYGYKGTLEEFNSSLIGRIWLFYRNRRRMGRIH